MARIAGSYDQIKGRIDDLYRKRDEDGLTATETAELTALEEELRLRDLDRVNEERLRAEALQREQRQRAEQQRKRGGGGRGERGS